MSCCTSKIKVKDLKNIPTVMESKDGSIAPENFDFLKEMMTRIDPGPYSWDDIDVWVSTYPSLDPYLQVDRTIMPETRPCMGSITVHSQRPDGKQAHFGIPDFWDMKELHHNPEFWWKNFEGRDGHDKNIKGHRKFDIKHDIDIELTFCGKQLRIDFRGQRTGEEVKPKKQREAI